MITRILVFISSILAVSCSNRVHEAGGCMENPGYGKLLVFIGEKIEVKEELDERASMDSKFFAKYKILEKVCGEYAGDTVEFFVFDHYGRPAFEKYKTVMLYLSEHDGIYYHEKYQFHKLYKTLDGNWASPYNWLDNNLADSLDDIVKPVKVNFIEEIFYSTNGLKKRDIKQRFPEPYYKIVDGKAIPVYGNYVNALFELKKRGVLKARGLFGIPDTTEPADIELEDSKEYKIPAKEKKLLVSAWNTLLNAIETQDAQKIEGISLDSVICSVCEGFSLPDFYNDVEPIDTFITTAYQNLPNTQLWDIMIGAKYKISATIYPDRQPTHFQVKEHESLIIYEVTFNMITKYNRINHHLSHSFQFVKVEGEFKFYGMESY